jgi:RNA polymerase sigma-70 factor, ECF subfamily
LADFSMNPELQYDANELEHTIQSCLETLPDHHQAVLILIDIEEFSYEEAAGALQVPTGTIKSRLARARAQFGGTLLNSGKLLPSNRVRHIIANQGLIE